MDSNKDILERVLQDFSVKILLWVKNSQIDLNLLTVSEINEFIVGYMKRMGLDG